MGELANSVSLHTKIGRVSLQGVWHAETGNPQMLDMQAIAASCTLRCGSVSVGSWRLGWRCLGGGAGGGAAPHAAFPAGHPENRAK